MSYELSLSQPWLNRVTSHVSKSLFVSGSLSVAVHDGPLHKEKIGCRQRSDCGFGHRVLPRLAAEVGGYFRERHGVSLFYDHMSHKHVLPGENEGIDHIGLRYHFKFHTN